MTHSGAILLDVIEVASMIAILFPVFSSSRTRATGAASGIPAESGDYRSTPAFF